MLKTPLVIVAEAKKNDFEQGWGQCAAELVAAQKINNDKDFPVYGIVTDGKLWEFGRLIKNIFIKNSEGYTIYHLVKLFTVLDYIFQSSMRAKQVIRFQNQTGANNEITGSPLGLSG